MRDRLFELVRIRRLLRHPHRDGLDRGPGRDHRLSGLQLVLDGRAWNLEWDGGHLAAGRRRNHQHLDHPGVARLRAFLGWTRTGCYPDGDQPGGGHLAVARLGAGHRGGGLRHLPQSHGQCDPSPGWGQMGYYPGVDQLDAGHRGGV